MIWLGIASLGICVFILFFYLLIWRKQTFDPPMLGLFTLGLTLIGIAWVQPDSVKVANIEITKAVTKAHEASDEARQASMRAEIARVTALETTAYLLWNTSHPGSSKTPERAAKAILQEIYGDKTDEVIRELKRKKIFFASHEEQERLSHYKIPTDINSPMLTHGGVWSTY